MNSWFQVKVKYQKQNDEGVVKNVTEPYLFDAISYTEAESRAYEELGEELSGEFTVTSVTKTNITEIVNHDDTEEWYKCKVQFVMLDEDAGKEKKVSHYHLISASTVKQAYERCEESLRDMLAPFEIPSIQLTPILEVFPYFTDEVDEQIPLNLKPIN